MANKGTCRATGPGRLWVSRELRPLDLAPIVCLSGFGNDWFHIFHDPSRSQIRPREDANACRLPFCTAVPSRSTPCSCWRQSSLPSCSASPTTIRWPDRLGGLEFPALLYRRSLASDILEHPLLRHLRGDGKRHRRTSAGARPQSRDALIPSLFVPPRLFPAGNHRRRLRLDRMRLFLRRRSRRHQLLPDQARPYSSCIG